jgi:hypothetical protein
MHAHHWEVLILALVLTTPAADTRAEARLPIIDMHLHARKADYIGSNPPAMCTPFEVMPRWDPAECLDAGMTFGSDQMIWPGIIEPSIEAIEQAPFLTQAQKRDIFYNNAARFLRLSKEEIARHHSL